MDILKQAELWVFAGLLIFFGILAWAKVPGLAARTLDERSHKIRATLDEANRLRDEAAALLEQLKAKRADAERQAAQMLADAETEAKRMEAEAKARLDEQIARRSALADRRIATAEAQALAEVKTAAADLAAQAAEHLLAGRLLTAKGDPLLDRAIGELGQRLQ